MVGSLQTSLFAKHNIVFFFQSDECTFFHRKRVEALTNLMIAIWEGTNRCFFREEMKMQSWVYAIEYKILLSFYRRLFKQFVNDLPDKPYAITTTSRSIN
mmetsp:Transcript_20449/g.23465  ORF Transcript_20449/g.23465 Transcript_20449/m.23465 type:complete len:100 (-) Transcript_20449:467-766(-)